MAGILVGILLGPKRKLKDGPYKLFTLPTPTLALLPFLMYL
jgi:hypothetical protein